MEVASAIGETVPPLRAFAAHLVELEHAVGLAPSRVVRDAPPGDERPGALMDDAPGLVLVHAEEDEMPGEVAGLRRAADDRPVDPAGNRIGRAEVIRRRIAEEGAEVAER